MLIMTMRWHVPLYVGSDVISFIVIIWTCESCIRDFKLNADILSVEHPFTFVRYKNHPENLCFSLLRNTFFDRDTFLYYFIVGWRWKGWMKMSEQNIKYYFNFFTPSTVLIHHSNTKDQIGSRQLDLFIYDRRITVQWVSSSWLLRPIKLLCHKLGP